MKSPSRFVVLLCISTSIAVLLYNSFFYTTLQSRGSVISNDKNSIMANADAADIGDRDLSSSLLETPLPRRTFAQFAKYPPHNINNPRKFAFATLMCTPVPNERDPFFAAAQSLIWRILWSDWHSQYPMIVFVCPSTPQYQRDIFAGQGAIVEEIELISGIIDPTLLNLSRWRDQLTKLNMWKYTAWERIAFLDVDAFPIANIDSLFDIVPTQMCHKDSLSADDAATMQTSKGQELCQYTFGGTIMSNQDGALNGGVTVFSPSLVWHAKLMRDLEKTDQYDIRTAEQGLLDSALGFGRAGAFPWFDFSQIFNADQDFYLEHRFSNDLKVLHFKLWSFFSLQFAPELNSVWDVDWMTMCRWYDGDIFKQARETGHRKEPLDVWVESQERKAKKQGEESV